jgi:DNA-binding transcriptional ArsR family regulator
MAPVRPAQVTRAVTASPAAGGGRAGAVSHYRPMAHPGAPRRWDQPSILAALHDWMAETRQVPRRNDWSGERPDVAGAAQQKWMREHPKWPSSSCVAAHFGSWSSALDAAGLPARKLTFDSSVADRVQTARRLAAGGMTIRAIARALGVSPSSIHNHLQACHCPECGGPVTNPSAERCAACAAERPAVARTWTRAEVCAAIRDWEAENPRWPSAAVVCDPYAERPDPWNAALRDAGAGVHLRRWSDDSVRSALADFWVAHGRPPTSDDLTSAHWNGPHAATLRRRFGGVAGAWGELGPAPRGQ